MGLFTFAGGSYAEEQKFVGPWPTSSRPSSGTRRRHSRLKRGRLATGPVVRRGKGLLLVYVALGGSEKASNQKGYQLVQNLVNIA